MANQEHLAILKQGREVWNKWKKQHPEIRPDLSDVELPSTKFIEADFSNTYLYGTDLSNANLFQANLSGADLSRANLIETNLSYAKLRNATLYRTRFTNANLFEADLVGADLSYADLSDTRLFGSDLNGAILNSAALSNADLREAHLIAAQLTNANLYGADLSDADLTKADLANANLIGARIVRTNLTKANLTSCKIHGISAWDVVLEETIQESLVITHSKQPIITVDDLEVAQFIYLLLNNKKIRQVIDTITSKVVLILGRFTPDRKAILDALKEELRKRNYSPVLFDFEKPASRDITETVSTLAHMARFVIADLTDAKSIPQELATIVPNLPSVPIQPLLLHSKREYGMFEHFTRFPWVLPIYHYTDEGSLLQSLKENIIEPAERRARELAQR